VSVSGSKTNSRAGLFFLLAVTAVALCFCYVLVAPFLKPILFSIFLAVLSFPLHSRIQRRVRNLNVSALLSTCLVLLFMVLSTVLLARALATGLRDVYQALSSSGDGTERLSLYVIHLFERAVELVSSYLPISTSDLRSATVNQAEKAVALLLGITAGVLSSFTTLLANAVIAFFVLFFLLRDGNAMLRRGAVLLPLRRDQTRRLFALVKDTVNATVYGTLTMAALQGALVGLAFWFLGVNSAGLWAIVTALCALLPFIGEARRSLTARPGGQRCR
jgi:predicted PurR-regulated permease PerM